jgi:DNA-binding CsgD family transcriptional regulator
MRASVDTSRSVPDASFMSVLATALFWAWCLVWVSNAGDSSWPVRSAETFVAVRVMWIIGMTSFAVLILWLRVHVQLNRRVMLMVATPLTTLGTLVVVGVIGHSGRDVLVLAVASLLTGFTAGTLLPTWTPSFDTGDASRLTLLITISALGAVALFHVGSLLPYTAASTLFVALPLLAGAVSLLDRSTSVSRPAPPALETSPSSAYVAPDIGFVVFGLVSGFTFGLNLLAYRFTPHSPLTVALIVASAVGALAGAAGLYAFMGRSRIISGSDAVLPLVVAGVLTLPYVSVNVSALMQVAVASNYLCSAMLFNLSQTDTSYRLKVGRWALRLSTRMMGTAAGTVGALLGLWVSHALDLGSSFAIGAFIAMAYTLLVAMTLLVSTRVSIFSRTLQTKPPKPACDVCGEIAREYRLTPREAEILAILATGRNQAHVQQALVIAPGTATTHITHIYQKLGIHNRSELLDLVEETRKADESRDRDDS